ncbi:MAG: mandelate racemase/muconate lactonizing enzyme family protein [Acidobacteria bacterium]|nr:mandelate racemase/muconate lactonizing enzyme family protein [Acidobacteriota bacterium]
MPYCNEKQVSRRKLMARTAALASFFKFTETRAGAQSGAQAGFNRNSAPSQLRITDMRAVLVASNYDYPIIRIDTNQGVYGLGEARDAGREGTALVLKPHLAGRNPLSIEPILDSLRIFSNHQRMGGGYSAVDMALHDIAGKVYGVPAWRLIGSKYRDRIRIYCDTTESKDPGIYAERFKRRKQMGFTFFKMDLGTRLVADKPDAVNDRRVATQKGLEYMCEYIQAVRDAIGWEAPLAADHFGPLTVNDSIRYARAFEKYNLAWAEDMIQVGHLGPGGDAPKDWRGYKELKEATTTPIATGESLFGLEEGFKDLIDHRAIDVIHPDPLTAGGIRETRRIADYASMNGVETAIHFAGSPVGCMASVHMAATLKDMLAMENHAVDIPWWGDLAAGPSKPIVNSGYISVPDAPGLGVELNEDVVKQHIRKGGYFSPTPQYDDYILDRFRTGGPYPHLDENGKPVVRQ